MRPPPDPIEMLAEAEPGCVLYGFSAETDLQIEILIRERSAEILAVGPTPEIGIRAGLLESGPVWIVVLLLKLREEGPVYTSWWNYHHPDADPGQGNLFHHMADGDNELLLKLIGDKASIERLLPFRHPLATFFKQATRRINAVPAWNMEEFLDALDQVRDNYPDAETLWASL